jgi:hypothetical protein
MAHQHIHIFENAIDNLVCSANNVKVPSLAHGTYMAALLTELVLFGWVGNGQKNAMKKT